MSNQAMAGLVLAFVLVGGGAFYGGMRYERTKAPAAPAAARFGGAGGAGFQGRRGGMGNAGGMVPADGAAFAAGEVLAQDGAAFTLKLRDGGSRIVLFASSTRVTKTAEGARADLAVGTPVVVNGGGNPDGSLTAETIQIRPASLTFPGMAPRP